MALFAVSDLHLPLGVNKPMDIFGAEWKNYVSRLYENWQSVVREEDTVVLPGDFSWATYLDDAKKDFEFLNGLNGRKILLKGNHDYWWETMSKMKKYTEENGFSNIYFLQNNFYEYKDIAVCGTRGWNFPSAAHSDEEDKKIYKREVQRLELSLSAAPDKPEKIVFTHFPPVGNNYTSNEFTEMLKKYNVRRCVYGHLHAKSAHAALTGNVGGVEYLLVSCDYVKFMPVKLSD